MKYNIYFDMCSVIIYLIVFFTLVLKKLRYGLANKTFLAFVLVSTLTAVLSLGAAICSNNPSNYSVGFRMILHTSYLLFRNITGVIYVLYIIALSDTWHKFVVHKIATCIVSIPILSVIILLATNIFTNKVFYINILLQYTRGKYFFILYISAMFYMFFGILLLVKYRKLIRNDTRIALESIVILTLFAVLIQLLNKTLLVEMFSNSIALLIIVILVRRPEDYYDDVTGLKKSSAYKEDIKRSYLSGKYSDVIIIDILNYDNILTMLGFDIEKQFLDICTKRILDVEREYGYPADIYHLDRGRFRVVFSGKKRELTEAYANSINEILNESFEIKRTSFTLMNFISVCTTFDDMSSYEQFLKYDNEISKVHKFDGKVLWAKEIVNLDSYILKSELDLIIDEAIKNNYFEVYYQPIYSVKKGKFTSAEALLRLKSPKYGFVPPDIFIPAAENSGAIYKIGEFVLHEVCKFISSSEFESLGVEYIEVNLSVAQCMQKNLAATVLNILEKYSVSSDKINLEITETAASYDQNVMDNNLVELSESGITFSLDDYGTGYSNIKRVASLPLKIVKLDKTFVNMDSAKMWIVLKNTIKMIKEMSLEIVVEGVENKDMLNKFEELDCEYIQGYYFSKPLQKNDFMQYVLSNNKKRA